MASFEADLVLYGVNPRLQQDAALFNFGLLAIELSHLLLQEGNLIDVHLLHFAKVSVEVRYILKDLFERIVDRLVSFVFESRELRPQKLYLLLVLVQASGEVLNIELDRLDSGLDGGLRRLEGPCVVARVGVKVGRREDVVGV